MTNTTICLYGCQKTGFEFIAAQREKALTERFTAKSWRNPEVLRYDTLTGALAAAVCDLVDAQAQWDGLVAIFEPSGERVCYIKLCDVRTFGCLTWQPAPHLVISADALIAAATEPQ